MYQSMAKITPFGKEVKKRLVDMGLTQREFCRQMNIPENRFSEILYGSRVAKKHREVIEESLEINKAV